MSGTIRAMLLTSFIIIVGMKCFCQLDSASETLVQQMLSRISYLQKHHDKDFPSGMVPSYRASQRRNDVLKNDDNIFFTGIVVFTLRYLYPSLDRASQNICDSIFRQAAPLYARHQNKKGRNTYNYWQTDQPEIFPNAGLLNLFNESQSLPDDMDVTSVVLLANQENRSTVKQVHQLMQDFTNGSAKKVKNTLPAYDTIKAYSTWFGKKMPVDFDFGVITNILYLVNQYKLPYTDADSASLNFLSGVVENRDYIHHPSIISPSYNRPPVLLYHLSRLMDQTTMPSLEKFKPQLIKDALDLYDKSANFFDKIILSTSLMRWGVKLPDEKYSVNKSLEEFTETDAFVFFIANMASMLPRPFNALLGKTGTGKFYYYCPGYNYVLMIENIVARAGM